MPNTEKFIEAARRFSTTIGAGGIPDASVATIPVTTIPAVFQDGDPIEIIVDRVSTTGTFTPDLEEIIMGIVSGTNIITADRGVEGTAQEHSAGAVVEIKLTADMWNRMVQGIKQEHNQDGTHSDITADTVETTALEINSTGPIDKVLPSTATDGELDDDEALVTGKKIKAYVDTEIAGSSQPQSLYENLLINGNMDISQRATTFVAGANNDDVYTLDQWNLLSDGNDVFDVSQEAVTDLAGSSYAIKLDVETAKRGGIIQFIESKDAIKFRGQTVSLSFAVKSANISALRASVMSWDGTADTLTSDVVGTWADTITPVANWTLENTPADLPVTSSWTTVKIEGIVLDTAGMNNLGIFIWTPNEETIGDIVYISQIKVNQGATATDFMPKSWESELKSCQRYNIRITAGNNYGTIATGVATTTTTGVYFIELSTPMRIVPTLTSSNVLPMSTAAGGFSISSLAMRVGAGDAGSSNTRNISLSVGVASGMTAQTPIILAGNNNAAGYINLSAEL